LIRSRQEGVSIARKRAIGISWRTPLSDLKRMVEIGHCPVQPANKGWQIAERRTINPHQLNGMLAVCHGSPQIAPDPNDVSALGIKKCAGREPTPARTYAANGSDTFPPQQASSNEEDPDSRDQEGEADRSTNDVQHCHLQAPVPLLPVPAVCFS
jgi:hypothetical protein